METIGVLGGFGPQATTVFEDLVHEEARRLLPPRFNQGYPPMVTVHLRHAPVLLEKGAPPTGPLRIDPRVLDAAKKLGEWADFLVVVANTPHLFLDEISEAAGRDVLSMVEEVVADLSARGVVALRDVQGEGGVPSPSDVPSPRDTGGGEAARQAADERPIGLLGLGVPEAYVRRFAQESIQWIGVPDLLRAALDDAILRTLELSTTDVHRDAAWEAVRWLRGQGCPAIVLGCTEIPLLLGAEADAPDLIDPGRLLAEAAVRRAVGA
ncbi:MAG: aspartate/glutamate racemase family protein [Candidatus Eisenbacteria bacterium]|uniref:Aspartate/glutamate racemase family protein n=1 Tax=Eiseniibacteriota bacterium TaxID=2212470 RepID=A0A956N922_UNCEI|nr:aspartate/glutamate racemase family protein [Candidatus Eisenbacteria bacterium]MCB9465210.1 aspartate/glutamate racemase family protein [Candidatus Eisenbacteria bacterium]